MSAIELSRRGLLESAGLLVVGFALGAVQPDAAAAETNTGRSLAGENLDSWLTVARDGSVVLYTGRVDLGTGTETLFMQFMAEELDVPIDRVSVVMGNTELTPDQGKTTASFKRRPGVAAHPCSRRGGAERSHGVGCKGDERHQIRARNTRRICAAQIKSSVRSFVWRSNWRT